NNGQNWLLFRGDTEFSGYADVKLSPKPVLLWNYKSEARTASSQMVRQRIGNLEFGIQSRRTERRFMPSFCLSENNESGKLKVGSGLLPKAKERSFGGQYIEGIFDDCGAGCDLLARVVFPQQFACCGIQQGNKPIFGTGDNFVAAYNR
ncbi:hypothetical protein EZS27_035898, partial [termite gut metagenome]